MWKLEEKERKPLQARRLAAVVFYFPRLSAPSPRLPPVAHGACLCCFPRIKRLNVNTLRVSRWPEVWENALQLHLMGVKHWIQLLFCIVIKRNPDEGQSFNNESTLVKNWCQNRVQKVFGVNLMPAPSLHLYNK